MKTIPLTQGKVAIVDDADFEELSKYKWCAAKCRHTVYALHRLGQHGYGMLMHRLILDASPDKHVDHKDGDGLNNRRENIRLCSARQNSQARKIKTVGTTSRFRGVSWDKTNLLWKSEIKSRGKNYFLGRFAKEKDAARAYDKKARELFGEYAAPNFI